jgi:hypothetical protein
MEDVPYSSRRLQLVLHYPYIPLLCLLVALLVLGSHVCIPPFLFISIGSRVSITQSVNGMVNDSWG